MAKGRTRRRDSATGTPSSLTTLLAPTQTPAAIITPQQFFPSEPLVYSVLRSEDQRQYHPARKPRTPKGLLANAAQIIGRGRPEKLAFKEPSQLAICVRRKQRKEVLHALKKTKKGSGSKRKNNFWSKIKC